LIDKGDDLYLYLIRSDSYKGSNVFMLDKEFEIRWHGRGGQGAVTSANMLAEAAYHAGFRGVMSAPAFGAERRGAPVTASTRLAPRPLRCLSQVEYPDMIVVLDDSLLSTGGAIKGLADNGFVIVNTCLTPHALGLGNGYRVAAADANRIAEEVGLIVSGALMINTAMLGAVARASGIIQLEHIDMALRNMFSPRAAKKNFEAARLTYEQTTCLSSVEEAV
jgi:pyruvate ferredoxin oxidoreductase gamma subunit